MRILVYGAGVLGCNLARNLFRAGKNVTLLARGTWAEQLRANGLRIKDKFSPRVSVSRISVVTELSPDDLYDVIFVVMRCTQLDAIMDTLRENRTKNIVFVGNNVQARALAAALPEKNVLFAFALSAGHREADRVVSIDLKKITIGKEEQKWADDALQHTFFVHKGYQPSYNYGEDINWQYWPVKDNELRWQLHRHKWFTPMGKAYRVSGDEKYAKEWAHQYIDWIKKNPLVKMDKKEYEMLSDSKLKGEVENVRFAWRPLEVSNRLQDQTSQFQLLRSRQPLAV